MTGRMVMENGLLAEAVSPTVMTETNNSAAANSALRTKRRKATGGAEANFVPQLRCGDRSFS